MDRDRENRGDRETELIEIMSRAIERSGMTLDPATGEMTSSKEYSIEIPVLGDDDDDVVKWVAQAFKKRDIFTNCEGEKLLLVSDLMLSEIVGTPFMMIQVFPYSETLHRLTNPSSEDVVSSEDECYVPPEPLIQEMMVIDLFSYSEEEQQEFENPSGAGASRSDFENP